MPTLLSGGGKGVKSQSCVAAAAYVSSHKSIEILLAADADVEAKWNWGNGPLAYAVASNNIDTLGFLLERGANVDATRVQPHGFDEGIDENQLEMVQLLLEFSPDTTLDNAIQKAAARQNGDRFLKALLDAGAIGAKSQSCVAAAATAGNVESIKMLLAAGADIDALTSLGGAAIDPSALHAAVKVGDEDLVARILDVGGDMHHVDPKDGNLLQIAAQTAMRRLRRFCLRKGMIQRGRASRLRQHSRPRSGRSTATWPNCYFK